MKKLMFVLAILAIFFVSCDTGSNPIPTPDPTDPGTDPGTNPGTESIVNIPGFKVPTFLSSRSIITNRSIVKSLVFPGFSFDESRLEIQGGALAAITDWASTKDNIVDNEGVITYPTVVFGTAIDFSVTSNVISEATTTEVNGETVEVPAVIDVIYKGYFDNQGYIQITLHTNTSTFDLYYKVILEGTINDGTPEGRYSYFAYVGKMIGATINEDNTYSGTYYNIEYDPNNINREAFVTKYVITNSVKPPYSDGPSIPKKVVDLVNNSKLTLEYSDSFWTDLDSIEFNDL